MEMGLGRMVIKCFHERDRSNLPEMEGVGEFNECVYMRRGSGTDNIYIRTPVTIIEGGRTCRWPPPRKLVRHIPPGNIGSGPSATSLIRDLVGALAQTLIRFDNRSRERRVPVAFRSVPSSHSLAIPSCFASAAFRKIEQCSVN